MSQYNRSSFDPVVMKTARDDVETRYNDVVSDVISGYTAIARAVSGDDRRKNM